ncbi:pescadillo homolog [Anopheles moucheti]|uniref:pescadillo homolog n=1 Tax=Anopheles moucheti TaxID=186751 RepID=UPI0022F08AC2|nr:pescadillo homolog [Anopheles moucheti]
MVKRNHKFKSGEGAMYYTRKAAMNKLQLNIKDFRQLCILKGVYPREPKHRARAQHGSREMKILYHKKDITFLLHEPIVWTLRDRKIFNRRIKHAAAKQNMNLRDIRLHNYPQLKLDHIVKERYPTFIDAIKELDDCMTLLFTFSTFPATKIITRELTRMSRRLTVEFMHYVIAAQALRKVFISIKGYYFQAEIKGETVTWIVPHYFPYSPHRGELVDLSIMKSFGDFFTVMAGFINYRLYHSINLVYPPQFSHSLDSEDTMQNEQKFVSERIAALNVDLLRSDGGNGDTEEAELLEWTGNDEDLPHVSQIRQEAQSVNKLKSLFKGLKFYLNREVPREPLVFIIRCFGGKVSWDKNMFVGATFDENDETITHQIVDRPSMDKQHISRDYIQPQWVFDSVNQRRLLPTNKYFIGAVLPPHLSPFTRSNARYVPPEEMAMRKGEQDEEDNEVFAAAEVNMEQERISDDEEVLDPEEEQQQQEYALMKAYNDERTDELDSGKDETGTNDKEESQEKVKQKENGKEKDAKGEQRPAKANQQVNKPKGMTVKPGKVYKEPEQEKQALGKNEEALRARMVKSRHRKLYSKLMEREKQRTKEANILATKRARIEKQKMTEQLEKQKKQRKQILA